MAPSIILLLLCVAWAFGTAAAAVDRKTTGLNSNPAAQSNSPSFDTADGAPSEQPPRQPTSIIPPVPLPAAAAPLLLMKPGDLAPLSGGIAGGASCAVKRVGCYQDSPPPGWGGAVLPTMIGLLDCASWEACAQMCTVGAAKKPGFKGGHSAVAGVGGGNVFTCWCGQGSGAVEPGARNISAEYCDEPCNADRGRTCGGWRTVDVFHFNCSGAPLPQRCLAQYPATQPCSTGPLVGSDVCNESLGLERRIDSLLDRMSQTELASLLSSVALSNGSAFGIGLYDWWSEALHGVNTGCSDSQDGSPRCPTSFPSPLAMSSSLNRSLWRDVGSAVGTEARAFSNLPKGSKVPCAVCPQ